MHTNVDEVEPVDTSIVWRRLLQVRETIDAGGRPVETAVDRLNAEAQALVAALTLPPFTPGLAAVAIAGTLLPDLAGIIAGILAASLLTVYALLGFAVLHTITRGMKHRLLVLGGTYGAVMMLGWPVLAVSLLGLAEAAFNFRRRMAGGRGPPSVQG